MINTECEKLIFRHPHIYGEVKVNDENDVSRNWEQLKLKEKVAMELTQAKELMLLLLLVE